MVYFTEILGEPRDTNLKPRVCVRIVVYKNALLCCFINPGLELNLIDEQKYYFHLLQLMGFYTHPFFRTCLFLPFNKSGVWNTLSISLPSNIGFQINSQNKASILQKFDFNYLDIYHQDY